MTDFDQYTLPDHLQGYVPPPEPLTEDQKDRLLQLSHMHPERRFTFLKRTDNDYVILTKYLALGPNELLLFLNDWRRENLVSPTPSPVPP